jgi:hypothetical protein
MDGYMIKMIPLKKVGKKEQHERKEKKNIKINFNVLNYKTKINKWKKN